MAGGLHPSQELAPGPTVYQEGAPLEALSPEVERARQLWATEIERQLREELSRAMGNGRGGAAIYGLWYSVFINRGVPDPVLVARAYLEIADLLAAGGGWSAR